MKEGIFWVEVGCRGRKRRLEGGGLNEELEMRGKSKSERKWEEFKVLRTLKSWGGKPPQTPPVGVSRGRRGWNEFSSFLLLSFPLSLLLFLLPSSSLSFWLYLVVVILGDRTGDLRLHAQQGKWTSWPRSNVENCPSSPRSKSRIRAQITNGPTGQNGPISDSGPMDLLELDRTSGTLERRPVELWNVGTWKCGMLELWNPTIFRFSEMEIPYW